MNSEQKRNASGASRLSVGLGIATLRKIGNSIFEDVNGGKEPLFELDNRGYYWHQSGYGCLSPERVNVVA